MKNMLIEKRNVEPSSSEASQNVNGQAVNNPSEQFNFPDFMRGVKNAIPIMVGYVPIALTYGILAVQSGLSVFETFLMSLIVYAGSSQFVAINLITLGVPFLSILVTTFVVNARHLLLSAALAPFLNGWSFKKQAAYSAGLTDETFAYNIVRFAQHGVNSSEAFGVHVGLHTVWVVVGVLGALLGSGITDIGKYGLDYALAALFFALLIPNLRHFKGLCAAILAALGASVFYLLGFEQWAIIIATVLAATLVTLFSPLKRRG